MLFNIAGLLNKDVGAIRSGSFSGEKIETDDGAFDDIEGTVKMLRTDATVLVTSEIAAKTTQTCGRCLGSAHLDLEVLIEEEFYPANVDLGSWPGYGDREPADLAGDNAEIRIESQLNLPIPQTEVDLSGTTHTSYRLEDFGLSTTTTVRLGDYLVLGAMPASTEDSDTILMVIHVTAD